MTTSERQKDLRPYSRKRFKKLIPELIEKDFGIPISSCVKNHALNVTINQNRKFFSFSVRKLNKDKQRGIQYKVSYRNARSNFVDYGGKDVVKNTVTEIYSWVKAKMIEDGLLTKEELIIQDIIE